MNKTPVWLPSPPSQEGRYWILYSLDGELIPFCAEWKDSHWEGFLEGDVKYYQHIVMLHGEPTGNSALNPEQLTEVLYRFVARLDDDPWIDNRIRVHAHELRAEIKALDPLIDKTLPKDGTTR